MPQRLTAAVQPGLRPAKTLAGLFLANQILANQKF